MALTKDNVRDSVKVKLDIPDSTFDTNVAACVEQATMRLAPFIQYQIPEDTSVTLASGDEKFTLPVAGSKLQKMFVRSSTTDTWQLVDQWQQFGDVVYVNTSFGQSMTVKVLATRRYTYSDADFTLLQTNAPAALLPLYLFAMTEFATYITGNKRKFNIYQQMNGARSLSEMQDLATFYENRALRILEDDISAEGQ